MSLDEAEQFIRDLMGDEELRRKFDERLGFDDPSEVPGEEVLRERMASVVPEFATEHGYEFDSEEGFQALDEVRVAVKSGELSDEELDHVAGGKPQNKKTAIGLTSASSAGIICGLVTAVDAAMGERCFDDL